MTATSDKSTVLPGHLLIGNERLTSASGGSFDHVNPSTGRAQRSLPLAGLAEIDRAVDIARAALPAWSRWNPVERRRVLQRFAELIRAESENLAVIASLEMGAPITQSPFLVDWGADWIEEAAGWADRLHGDVSPLSSRNVHEYTSVEPIGVVAALPSWNASVGAFGMTIAAPLAAGCTVVAKPSELAPFAALRIGEIALQAGVPAGVLNVVTAGIEASEALVSHPGVDKITFTGGPSTARRIAEVAAQALTPAVFELGGKSASLIFADADIDRALSMATMVAMNAGQACTLGTRILVHESRRDEFMEKLVAAVSSIPIGDPFAEGIAMGPVISEKAVDRITGMVERSRTYGEVITGGERCGGELADGFFLSPAVVALPSNYVELARDEVFGPVLGVQTFVDEEEAVTIANDSDFGLAGYLFTSDISTAHRVAGALDTGNVGVNGGWAPAGPQMGFGGRKQSGYGIQGGLRGTLEFVSFKSVQIAL
ncbi:aldehyde dehydrogenase [Rhodococcus sp. 14C212]|uniref:aldehyde dehydrogenase family protein n=1 Tax=Rhodococcus sp. 14C212 TaxID=2711209 RepID=UPI0013ED92AE|nr:aldehyde dehydrogenase family protein [Rhodococcus sp. 14C212]NGP05134.1 aldehyde dehydrogenase [Rhodococcus sp. 14C212]